MQLDSLSDPTAYKLATDSNDGVQSACNKYMTHMKSNSFVISG